MHNNSPHIFFVDDEPKIHQVVTDTLKQLGAGITCFSCASDCLEQLDSQKCDLLITDLRMPEMNGMELLRHTKSMAPWLPILIMSGYGDIPTAVEAIKAGAVDFIQKPLDKKSFARKVKCLLPKNGNHKHLGRPLTQSEQKVLKLILNGKSNSEIGNLLNRSQRTIEAHRSHVMHKLGAGNIVGLFKQAAMMGLVDSQGNPSAK